MDEDEGIFEILFVIVAFMAVGMVSLVVIGGLYAAYNRPPPPDYSKGPIHVKTNELGCEKYEYYNSSYWKCPEELNINSIEERVGKHTATTPVIKDAHEP